MCLQVLRADSNSTGLTAQLVKLQNTLTRARSRRQQAVRHLGLTQTQHSCSPTAAASSILLEACPATFCFKLEDTLQPIGAAQVRSPHMNPSNPHCHRSRPAEKGINSPTIASGNSCYVPSEICCCHGECRWIHQHPAVASRCCLSCLAVNDS
jgi:hypothetical protein